MRYLDRFLAHLDPKRSQARTCDAAACTQTTREGKPYCPDHVDLHPYVQDLISNLSTKDEQDDAVKSKGPRAVKLDSITVQELLLHLELNGPRTEERLVRELNLDLKTVSGYVQALRRKQLVTTGYTKRGSMVVKLAVKPSTDQNAA